MGTPLSGGGGASGRYRNEFFPITFIEHNQKSNGGRQWGGMVRMGEGGMAAPYLRYYIVAYRK